MDELFAKSALVDSATGEVIGYVLTNGLYCIAMTRNRIEAEGLELANYIEYCDMDLEKVAVWGSKYALMSSSIYRLDDLESVPCEMINGKVAIYGDVFEVWHFMELDNDTAIKNIKENIRSKGYAELS